METCTTVGGPTDAAVGGERYGLLSYCEASEYLKGFGLTHKTPLETRNAIIRGYAGEEHKIAILK